MRKLQLLSLSTSILRSIDHDQIVESSIALYFMVKVSQ